MEEYAKREFFLEPCSERTVVENMCVSFNPSFPPGDRFLTAVVKGGLDAAMPNAGSRCRVNVKWVLLVVGNPVLEFGGLVIISPVGRGIGADCNSYRSRCQSRESQ
jgi:hypothetical protein